MPWATRLAAVALAASIFAVTAGATAVPASGAATPAATASTASNGPATPASGDATPAGGDATATPATTGDGGGVRSFFVQVPESPGSSASIPLDVDLYTPATTPAPAVLLAHGFGQTKTDLAPEARELQADGYVVLAYTARGFGQSGGSIGLDSLDGEVPDARALVDVLAGEPTVQKTDGDDPVVGVVGGSYGGALALMLGATDPRVDTVVAAITWNDLAQALVPTSAATVLGDQATTAPATGGSATATATASATGAGSATALRDFKAGWAARLYGAGIAPAADGAPANPCGRFTPAFCALYQGLISGAQPSAADLALLARSSPATVLSGMRAPTLLLQGIQDNLFGLDQADANARQLAAAGAPVQVRWFNGGHDGGGIGGTDTIIESWLADHLAADLPVPSTFSYAVPPSATTFAQTFTAAAYPGLGGADARQQITLAGPETTVVNPPGGEPASVTGIPGLDTSSAAGLAASALLGAADPPAERARFVSPALAAPVVLAGAATVPLRIAPAVPTTAAGEALLYAQLAVQSGDTVRALPGGVAPLRLVLPADGATVEVTLPATAYSFAAGDHLVLTLRTTDSQFSGATEPAAYTVAVAGPISLPTVAPAAVDSSEGQPQPGVLLGIAATLLAAVLLVVGGMVVARRRRARGERELPSLDTPAVPTGEASTRTPTPALQIEGLTKRFRSGFLAVDDVSFTVERGQVLGLLGENGAGKTTTLRMVTGLLRPDTGIAFAFGVPIAPGSPVLARVGCFIEGPGFLPHLSGRRNLELYWAATGRPRAEARFDEALAVADLGGAIAKPVRGYSQGMRQRLAIAQAMLGMPDLLILDEPTNGLDPPQITALRGVLRRYAEGGRTVIVSSHLLGEVELTCTHVVVMSHGRVVASGAVDEVAGGGRLETAFLSLIGATEPSA
ncbi:hypothetical protein C5B96_10350 [Subtercola sp. Z020]|uniref:alpha/beta fold hydrolase n=1 Tax=Subtercola sp. Z020 TaxID=2080582 RepID=UPI000CE89801|nr:alpha/beta fold hydrolase [Subtercola sp. Z020]PPF81299.1 hypothetical protein C5B96_10350 [Subtercola sp. Z020]